MKRSITHNAFNNLPIAVKFFELTHASISSLELVASRRCTRKEMLVINCINACLHAAYEHFSISQSLDGVYHLILGTALFKTW